MKSAKSRNKMDVYDVLHSAVSSEDLIECANYLLLLAELALQDANRRKVADIFKSRLMDSQLAYMSLYISNKKPNCFYFSGMSAVQQYLSININPDLPPVKLFKSLVPLGQKILNDFTEPSGKQVSKKSVEDILEYLNNNFDFTTKVYGEEKPIFISIDNSHRIWNSVTAISDNPNRQYILLYHLKPETEVTPEFVLLHELGHVVHTRYCSSATPPESFHRYIRKEILEQANSDELCEIFADAFATAVLYDSPFSQYDTADEAPLEHKQSLKEYFSELIK